jgi:hypothetical protein
VRLMSFAEAAAFAGLDGAFSHADFNFHIAHA